MGGAGDGVRRISDEQESRNVDRPQPINGAHLSHILPKSVWFKDFRCRGWGIPIGPLSSFFLGVPCRIPNINHKKELLRGLWVGNRFRACCSCRAKSRTQHQQ